ncbi:dihydroxyacetone kinase phosphoryl donor subunit DhaM [Tessaracoccus defluvii]|uniref:Phosphocarrier protein HPr n=1 Tax=Tessaracoccus defluvii TaxID=1285901 RepID=A0A7H0H660_9ACTN|nr:dihydroxyacetone kinase phosphoryl donor subunit DhaM [Tessaracoccus defluvii]QNP56026.1 HPr family phosphocarrier protein [Tessaracoccus defluvii]
MAVGIVVVSHSRALAEAAVEVAMQMVHEAPPPLAIAAGTDDGGLGTDATAVLAALTEVDRGDGVVVFVDVGSSIMSAELGIEFYGAEDADIRVLPAPFVEGLLAGVVRAAGGATIDEVAAEANAALTPKLHALGTPDPAPVTAETRPEAEAEAEARAEATIVNATGLHARPAALFVAKARAFDATVLVACGDEGPVSATSTIGLATLGAGKGAVLRLSATGPQAREAVDALAGFVASGLGD